MGPKAPPPHRSWSSQHPIPCLRHRLLLHLWYLHPAEPLTHTPVGPPSVQSATPIRRRGLTWQPRRLPRSPALAERSTCPRCGLYPEPRSGGAGRRLRPRQARAQCWAPPRSQRARLPRAEVSLREPRRESDVGARRASRELAGNVARGGGNRARCGSSLQAGSRSAGLAGGSYVRRALRSEPVRDLRSAVFKGRDAEGIITVKENFEFQ